MLISFNKLNNYIAAKQIKALRINLDYIIALSCAGLDFLRVCCDNITAKFISKAKTVEPCKERDILGYCGRACLCFRIDWNTVSKESLRQH